jgi:hypothetical protein
MIANGWNISPIVDVTYLNENGAQTENCAAPEEAPHV